MSGLYIHFCGRVNISLFTGRHIFRPKNFRPGGVFKICRTVCVFEYLLFLKSFAYFSCIKHAKKYFYILKKYIIVLHCPCPR